MCKDPNRCSSFFLHSQSEFHLLLSQGQRGGRWILTRCWQMLAPDKKSNCGEINFWMVAFEVPFYTKSNPVKVGLLWNVTSTFDLFISFFSVLYEAGLLPLQRLLFLFQRMHLLTIFLELYTRLYYSFLGFFSWKETILNQRVPMFYDRPIWHVLFPMTSNTLGGMMLSCALNTYTRKAPN